MDLGELGATLRRQRGFDAEEVAAAKVGRIRRWFAGEGLDAAVVGLSGGVDSALVAALLARAAVGRVVGLVLPVDRPGATDQALAARDAVALAEGLGIECWASPLGDAHDDMRSALEAGSGLAVEPWAAGQMVSVLRTPALYGAAALLQQEGHRSVVVGTTNRDEGAFLGFFGKASDGMVDVQPVGDLHKSEVRAAARVLGVPAAIVERVPRGDVHDGRTDEVMLGATYDEVEVVLRLRELGLDPEVVARTLDPVDAVRLKEVASALTERHERNAHKYRAGVGSSAVFLDVLPRGIPGGWPDEVLSGRAECPPAADDVPALWFPPPIALDPVAPPGRPRADAPPPWVVVDGALTADDCRRLRDALAGAPVAPVDVTGRQDPGGPIGSHRATAWAPDLAADLWARLRPSVTSMRFLDEHSATDGWGTERAHFGHVEVGHADGSVSGLERPPALEPVVGVGGVGLRRGHRTWRVVGLSPLLRFMRYERGGHHLVHYDAGYDYGDGRRTLQSVVIFLTGEGLDDLGGHLRFVDDGQSHLPTWERDHRDWERPVREEEVRAFVAPNAGSAVVFDHRIPHDVSPWLGAEPRIVIRADIVFEAIPDGRSLGPGAASLGAVGIEDSAERPAGSGVAGAFDRPPSNGGVGASRVTSGSSSPTALTASAHDPRSLPWKVARDPYLAPLARRHGVAAAYEAGFFEDDDPADAPLDDVGWLCTPTDHVRRSLLHGRPVGLDPETPPVVLLSTGGFHPVHAGHLAMLRAARDRAGAAGWWVVGAYLSPGHDDYLALKCGPEVRVAAPAAARLAAAEEALGVQPWIAVDPWEAQARPVAVNYTDVTARLQAYLRHHVDARIEVAYVAGADNARFALAFAERGRAVVVGRPGSEAERDRWRRDPRVPADRVLWADGADPSSSTGLRPVAPRPTIARLVLREEDERAVAALGLDTHRWRRFQSALRAELATYVDVRRAPWPPPSTDTIRTAGRDPSASADRAVRVLSLDPFVRGDADLAVSRCFDLGGHRLLGHVARPGAPPLPEQMAAILPGRWRVWDDDRASGGTLRFLRSHLTDGVELVGRSFAVDAPTGTDVADSRDFLLGTEHGGLVVELPDGMLGRVPYLQPYVDPSVRSAVPPARARAFSVAVWRLGADTFHGTGITVADLPPAAQRPLLLAGHLLTSDLSTLCHHHAALLESMGA